MELSEKVAIARKRKGLTQEQLADLANVTVRTIQRIERGESIPRAFTIKTLAKALGTNFEDLANNETQNDSSPNVSAVVQNNFNPDNERHILKILCLSCFSYLAIPLVHFIIPIYLLKHSGSSNTLTINLARVVIRRQIYWAIVHSFLLLLTLAYNFINAVYFEASYLLHYLWPFFTMYILNAFIIMHSLIRINNTTYSPVFSV
ncbi:Helix-turn-helix [Parapedobacter luteus]|uniref:Helix-turn-helix n=1 Tax=Parapedobacter luteus TaxID=623280 RepID=A0A1T5ERY7_9SPHI|nr:helix-turn-helix transcriptional regulator [Parapedobacter luteus]SKB86695.1 Helix-turn-helix [Parapedobacter luteus]